jgi:CRISPR/Cas system-associated protein Cas10 (large subunit of type III CRISPR-Cas system)
MNNDGDIPDHSICSPFGSSEKMKSHNERFNKYRHYIIPWFKDLYNVRKFMRGGFECSVCGAWLSNGHSTRLLGHLSTLKHLRVALGDELHESDKRYRSGIGSKHRIHASGAIIDSVVGDVTSGLGEDGK